MPRVRTCLLLTLGLLMSGLAAAQEKKETKKEQPSGDAAKIVGIWEMQDPDLAKIDAKATFEFKTEGKATMKVEVGKQKPIEIDGTYKIDGNKLTLTAKKNGKDETEVVKMRLTDSELVLTDKNDKEVRFKKPESKQPAKEPFPKSPFPMGGIPKSPF